jgi:hypothetical protein
MKEINDKEITYYGNFGYIEECDLCHEYKPIANEHDGKDFIVYDGKQFLCKKCRE